MTINMQKLYDMVWQFRQDTAAVFPVPDRADSLRFAFTEAGEALDAYLRQNGDYKRNRDKAHSVEREFAQCVMMLLTALGPGSLTGKYYPTPDKIDDICYTVARAMIMADNVSIIHAVRIICGYVPTIEDELAAALNALRQKHLELIHSDSDNCDSG